MLQTGCMSALIRKQEEEQHRVYQPYSGTVTDLKLIAAPILPMEEVGGMPLLVCPPVGIAVATFGAIDLPGSTLSDTINLGCDLRRHWEKKLQVTTTDEMSSPH